MVSVSVQGDRVAFEVEGWDRLWALKSRLEIPLAHIRAVRADRLVVPVGFGHEHLRVRMLGQRQAAGHAAHGVHAVVHDG